MFGLMRDERFGTDGIHVDCDCHEPDHFFRLDWWPPDPKHASDRGEFFGCLMVSADCPLRTRIGRTLRYLFSRQDIVIGDVVMDLKSAAAVRDFIDQRLKESES